MSERGERRERELEREKERKREGGRERDSVCGRERARPFSSLPVLATSKYFLQQEAFPDVNNNEQTILLEEGVRGLFLGLTPRIGRSVLSGAIQFATYETVKKI